VKYPSFVFIEARRVKLVADYPLPDGRYMLKGFESDLGSVPRSLWWLLSPYDIKYASIIHDYEWLLADSGNYSYSQSNKNFYKNAVQLDEVARWKALVSFVALEIVKIYKIIYSRMSSESPKVG
jgi:hypothetical protein